MILLPRQARDKHRKSSESTVYLCRTVVDFHKKTLGTSAHSIDFNTAGSGAAHIIMRSTAQ